ncbi:ImmA/IrrE family metallo-endopeptidase [Bradyrhizobium elkanii]|uniref:ImmA/IrrE family metallo-endopeptidase n=1 Tax=Bradyrhizobium elkanii TaxID=29448 RepID=UPI00209D9DC0|nr:DUF955 domain-containing protein [Bradyrhizobium elkanii]MCP1975660.1 hypothetical protein [Bradyrhizobium elkanii]MCS3482424.1 hypothetical protein [Bradyrhizobium elkanii]MCS3525196.1 hypothetical protein [Bradyrhizobium elkanii]MCS4075901.1 hypothetical protein [Bradyrhizobium elkanii]MCS4085159.1 hypothetical protein [Bradyrhizobium elkanii]
MKNAFLRRHTAEDIDGQIAKILRGLGNPEPPLRIEDVRELLRLDTKFYSSTDAGIFRETISRMFVGARQVINRPSLLGDALTKFQLKALWIPDHKRILIDSSVPKIKHRWIEAHEVTHSVLPWHRDCLFGDTEQTLTPSCHEKLEDEANFGAGRLLFLGERFLRESADFAIGLDAVRALSKRYGNTLTSTLWRFVECLGDERPLVGLVSVHPRRPVQSMVAVPVCRYFIRSRAFDAQFPNVNENDVFEIAKLYCGRQSGGPLGEAQITLTNARAEARAFKFETFYNGYDALTLGAYSEP